MNNDYDIREIKRQIALLGNDPDRLARPQHREAFALMQYESDDGSVSQIIWNSRDGVTPFCVTIDGIETRHVRWGQDIYAPDYQPVDDDLVWITARRSLDEWRALWKVKVEGTPQYAPPAGPERDALIEKLARSSMVDAGEEGTVALATGADWRRIIA